MKSGILFFGILMLFAQTATGTNESFLSIAVSHTGATYSFELNFSWDEMGAGDPIPGLPEEEMENYPSSAIPEIVYFIEYGDGQVERFKGTTLSHTFSHEYEYEISGGFQVVAHATPIYSVLDEPDSQSAQVDPNVSGVTPPTNLSFFESGETVPTGSNGVAKIDLEWTGARQGDVVRANVKFMRNSSGVQTNAIVFFKVPKGTITFEDAVEVPDVVHDKIQFGDSAGDIDALVVESTTNYLYFQKLLRFDNSTNKEGVFFTDIVVDANLSDGNFPIEVGYVGPGNTTDFWSSSLSSTTSNLDGLDTDQTLSLMVNSARDPNNFSVDPAYLLVNLNPGADDLTDPANFELLEDPNDFDFNLFIQNESLESVVGAILVGIDPDSRLEAAAASIIPDFVHLGLPHFDYEIHKLEDIRLTRAINILESSSFTTVDYDRFEENLWLIQPERSRTDNGVLGGNDLGAFSFSMNNVSLSGLIPGDEISSGAMVVFIGQLPVGSNSVFERLGDPSDNSSLLTITDVTETNAAITRVICANCSPDPPNPSGTSPCNCCPSEVRADSGSSIIILNNSNGNTIEVNIGDDDEDDDEAAGSSNDGGAIRGFKVGIYLPNNRQDGPQIESGKLAGLVYRKRLSQEVADKSLNRFFTDSWFLMEIMAGQINIRESSLADAHSLVQLDFPVGFEYTIYNSKSVSTNLALGIAANVRLNEPDISPNLIGNNYLGWSLFADLNAWNATISRLDLRVGLRYNFILQKVLERFPSNYASFYLSAGIRD